MKLFYAVFLAMCVCGGFAQAAPPSHTPPSPVPFADIAMTNRGPDALILTGHVIQGATSKKWPRVKSLTVQIHKGGRWQKRAHRRVQAGYSQRLHIELKLPAHPKKLRVRLVLKGSKRVVWRGKPKLVRRPGKHLKARSLSVGDGQVCAVLPSRRAACWGANMFGELGRGFARFNPTPRLFRDLGKVASISAGSSYTCAITLKHRLKCWGNNIDGVLGTGNLRDADRPKLVRGLHGVKQMSDGGVNACVTRFNGSVYCWGSNGRFGGNLKFRLRPEKVKGVNNASKVVADVRESCAILKNNRLSCWSNSDLKAKTRREFGKVKDYQRSLESGCLIRMNNLLSCWGDNYFGQLGNGTRKSSRKPKVVPGLGPVKSFSLGFLTNCAVRMDGRTFCWGAKQGSLFDGLSKNSLHLRPRMLPGLRSIRYVEGANCALAASGSVYCWGDNSAGSLGTGTKVDQMIPVPVLAGSTRR